MKTLAPALILASLAWPLMSPPAHAEDGPYYLVEVIVLTHAAGRSDGREIDQLTDFNNLVDPLRQARIAAWRMEQEARIPEQGGTEDLDLESPEQNQARETVQAMDLFSALDAIETASDPEISEMAAGPVYPDRFVNQAELSPTMQSAWNRLSNSGEFQPRTWRAWYQPLSRSRLSPQVRIHDEFPLRLNWADLALPALPGTRKTLTIDQLMPKADYRLDGSLRLRQRQFMHLELDLVWRELVEQEQLPAGPWAPDVLAPVHFQQHHLNQSRTVRLDRLEYFDSSWLGVLVRIQRWVPPEAEEPNTSDSG